MRFLPRPAPQIFTPPHKILPLARISLTFTSCSGMSQTKSLVDTEKTSIVFNHYPVGSLEATWTNHEVKRMNHKQPYDLDHQVGLDVGQTHHYRGDCDFEVSQLH